MKSDGNISDERTKSFRERMRNWLMSGILATLARTKGAALVAQAYSLHANDITGEAWLSEHTLMAAFGLSRATIARARKACVDVGWMSPTDLRGRCRKYIVHVRPEPAMRLSKAGDAPQNKARRESGTRLSDAHDAPQDAARHESSTRLSDAHDAPLDEARQESGTRRSDAHDAPLDEARQEPGTRLSDAHHAPQDAHDAPQDRCANGIGKEKLKGSSAELATAVIDRSPLIEHGIGEPMRSRLAGHRAYSACLARKVLSAAAGKSVALKICDLQAALEQAERGAEQRDQQRRQREAAKLRQQEEQAACERRRKQFDQFLESIPKEELDRREREAVASLESLTPRRRMHIPRQAVRAQMMANWKREELTMPRLVTA